MKKLVLFALFLGLFPTFQCIDCDCEPVLEYFVTTDFSLEHHQNEGARTVSIVPTEPIAFDDYAGLRCEFEVGFIASAMQERTSFSLYPTLLACSCLSPGEFGSRTERFQEVVVETLYDVDSAHSKGDTINDLLDIKQDFQYEPLNPFLMRDTGLISQSYFYLKPTDKPASNDTFQVKCTIVLNDSTQYSKISDIVIFR